MTMPTEREMDIIAGNMKVLESLTDIQLVMLALSTLVMEATEMPPGDRIPLHATLRARSGIKG